MVNYEVDVLVENLSVQIPHQTNPNRRARHVPNESTKIDFEIRDWTQFLTKKIQFVSDTLNTNLRVSLLL